MTTPTPWTLPATAWPSVVAMLELVSSPWPEVLALHDLAFLRLEVDAGGRPRPPGRDFLAARWGWSAHQVRQFLEANPPARRQPKIPAIGRGTSDPAITESTVTSGTPGHPPGGPTEASRTPGAAPELEAGSPGQRQPAASSGTGERREPPEVHQANASPPPGGPGPVPPHTPPPDLSSQLDLPDQDRSGGGTGGDPFALLAPTLRRAATEVPEARTFLRVWTRWRNHPKAPHRWTGGPAEALSWFLELLGSDGATEIGKAIAVLDVSASLEGWDAWLGDRADEHGRAGTAERSKFPRGWKQAIRTWLLNQAKFGRNLKATSRRRGAWAGRATPFHDPAPTTPADLAPPPPGDPHALDQF